MESAPIEKRQRTGPELQRTVGKRLQKIADIDTEIAKGEKSDAYRLRADEVKRKLAQSAVNTVEEFRAVSEEQTEDTPSVPMTDKEAVKLHTKAQKGRLSWASVKNLFRSYPRFESMANLSEKLFKYDWQLPKDVLEKWDETYPGVISPELPQDMKSVVFTFMVKWSLEHEEEKVPKYELFRFLRNHPITQSEPWRSMFRIRTETKFEQYVYDKLSSGNPYGDWELLVTNRYGYERGDDSYPEVKQVTHYFLHKTR